MSRGLLGFLAFKIGRAEADPYKEGRRWNPSLNLQDGSSLARVSSFERSLVGCSALFIFLL